MEDGCKLPSRDQQLDSLYDADRKRVTAALKTAQNNHHWSRRQVVLGYWELTEKQQTNRIYMTENLQKEARSALCLRSLWWVQTGAV